MILYSVMRTNIYSLTIIKRSSLFILAFKICYAIILIYRQRGLGTYTIKSYEIAESNDFTVACLPHEILSFECKITILNSSSIIAMKNEVKIVIYNHYDNSFAVTLYDGQDDKSFLLSASVIRLADS